MTRRAGRSRFLRWRLRLALLAAVLLGVGPLGDLVTGFARGGGDCRVIGVVDGDTVRLWCRTTPARRGRIVGLDAPEVFSPGCLGEALRGWAATWALRWQLWTAGDVNVRITGQDRYGRALVVLVLDGESAAERMVRAGWARPYSAGRRARWCGPE